LTRLGGEGLAGGRILGLGSGCAVGGWGSVSTTIGVAVDWFSNSDAGP
jgi:hypothetical protein